MSKRATAQEAEVTHLAARRGVLEVLEHREVIARREERVVRVRARDDRAKHDRLVGLVLEVGVPEVVELRTHFLQLGLSWSDLKCTMRTKCRIRFVDSLP